MKTKVNWILGLFMLFSVPNVYPVDLFEHIWAVDRLQRLGISRFFRSQIVECVNYVRRYTTKSESIELN